MMGGRIRQIFGETPFLFFGVVLGVAILFRVGVGVARESAKPDVVAPTFVSTQPEPGLAPAATASASTAPTGAPSTTTTAEVGAAARVQPIGTPVRVPPKTRGHGRRPIHP
jgi:hypothetical protein